MNAHSSKSHCGGIAENIVARHRQSRMPRWFRRHLESCERCRRLVLGNSRARWAMLLVRTDACSRELLMQANRRAIGMISRSLRDLPETHKLRHAERRMTWRQRVTRYTQGVAHAAACLLVLVMIRTGWLASLTRVHEEGTKIARQYFQRGFGQNNPYDGL